MKTKHTKGEWKIEKETENKFLIFSDQDKKNEQGKRLAVASCLYEKPWQDQFIENAGLKEDEVRRDRETAESNAKLIAAAPALLKALEEMVNEFTWENYELVCDHSVGVCACNARNITERAMDAIKKATE